MWCNSFVYVVCGSDGVLFFQWCVLCCGVEKFYLGMVFYVGQDMCVWCEVFQFGVDFVCFVFVCGSCVVVDVVLLWDYESWWVVEFDLYLLVDVIYFECICVFYGVLWKVGVIVDIVYLDYEWFGYQLVFVLSLYMVSDVVVEVFVQYVCIGGYVVVFYFSGIVDFDDVIWFGGYFGVFCELFGVCVEEFCLLYEGEMFEFDDGMFVDVWSEDFWFEGVQVVCMFVDGCLVVIWYVVGEGVVWYCVMCLDFVALLVCVCVEVGVELVLVGMLEGVEVVCCGDFVFVINYMDVVVQVVGEDLLGGDGIVFVGGVVVVKV